MKIKHFLFVLVVLLPGLALSQNDVEQQLNGNVQQTTEVTTTAGSTQTTSQVEIGGSLQTAGGSKDYASVQQIEDHVLRGDKPRVVKNYYNTYKTYVTPTRAKTKRPEEGTKTMPNQNVPKNPNVDGAFKVDPNIFPEGNGSVTVSAGADGSFYVHRDSGSASLGPWLWVILGVLAFGLVMVAIAAMLRGGGSGGNTININNVPGGSGSNPQPPAPQAQGGNGGLPAPFVQPNQPAPSESGPGNGTGAGFGHLGNQPGVVQNPVVLVHAYPTGSPAQDKKQDPVVINNHIHLPKPEQPASQKPPQQKKTAAKKTETEKQ